MKQQKQKIFKIAADLPELDAEHLVLMVSQITGKPASEFIDICKEVVNADIKQRIG